MPDPAPDDMRGALRSPYLPTPLADLAAADGYLAHVWPALELSIATQGFLDSARYMADMALDAVEEVYEPVMGREDVIAAGVEPEALERLVAVLDVFHYVQPQALLACAALAEAWDRPSAGGHGREAPRPLTEREERHLAAPIAFAAPATEPLPAIAEALGMDAPPDLFRAMASWPGYLSVAWEELQHLAAYPQFRRRGRGLYYYARSGSRFLARPIEANAESLRVAGLTDAAIAQVTAALDRSVPALAMLVMHTEAMRAGLGIRDREVVRRPE